MTFKRKLIFEDKSKQNDIILGIKPLYRLAEAVKTAYNSLELGKLDNDTYKAILSGGYSYVESKVLDLVNDQLTKAGITFKAIKKMQIEAAYKALNDSGISQAIDKIQQSTEVRVGNFFNTISVNGSVLSFDGEKFYVDKEGMESLFEQHTRFYINTHEEQGVYDQLLATAKAISEQNTHLNSIGVPPVFLAPQGGTGAFLFTQERDGLVYVQPSAVAYIKGYLEGAARMKERERLDRERKEARAKREESDRWGGKTFKEVKEIIDNDSKARVRNPITEDAIKIDVETHAELPAGQEPPHSNLTPEESAMLDDIIID